MSNAERAVTIYTDGACKGNPGPGGWAAVLSMGKHERVLFGWAPETTNNRMELLAVIEALSALKRPCEVEIYSDSQYVIKGITSWISGWKRRGWKKVKNVDLWKRLDSAIQSHQIKWNWVRGHSGDAGNERVDRIASHCATTQAEPDEDILGSQ